jgi:hypothetical protein
LIASHIRGISILDQEKSFSCLELVDQFNVPPFLGKNTITDVLKMSDNPRFDSNSSPGYKRKVRASMGPKQLFPQLFPLKSNINSIVSTALKDEGLGLPTFALLSTEIQIKSAAEASMNLLFEHLSNFPPKKSCFGVTKLDSAWKELNYINDLKNSEADLKGNTIDKHIRYYSYQKRLILGLIEIPAWDLKRDSKNSPMMVVTTRDSFGKFSYMSAFRYLEPMTPRVKIAFTSFDKITLHRPIDVIAMKSVNESMIPTILDCSLDVTSDMEMDMNAFKAQCKAERSFIKKITKPTEKIVNKLDDHELPKSFRLFLSTMGLLDYKSHHDLVPLVYTENLQRDLDKLDNMPWYKQLI